MAKSTLPTNYKDDVLTDEMNGKYRYVMEQNSDGTYSFVDATDYEQIGSAFGAGQINAINTAVNASIDSSKIIDNLADLKAVTASGYIAGAKAVAEWVAELTS